MIEEKNLKKTFIIATLISTIIGTFTTGVNLYERVGQTRKQIKKDGKQDDKITELEKRINEKESQRQHHANRADQLQESLSNGGPMVKREYDRDFGRLGPRFAEGDHITQTQLQSQVITLQGTVINLLEGALLTGRLENPGKLYNASEFARDGSIRALRDQYQRMLQAAPIQRPMGPVRRISSQPAMSQQSHAGRSIAGKSNAGRSVAKSRGRDDRVTEINEERNDERSSEIIETTSATQMMGHREFDASGDLFCKYAEQLQKRDGLLADNFQKGGSCACPECGTRIGIQPGRAWRIDKELLHERVSTDRVDKEQIEERTYFINNRFIVKCHREGAGFACILCFRYREADTLCETAQRFVNHVWKKHSVAEYEMDPDIEEKALFESRVTKGY